MPTSTADKLRIRTGMTLLTLHAPADFAITLNPLPKNVIITAAAKSPDQIHWFVTSQAQLNKELGGVLKLLKENTTLWIYYPKGSSGMQTDLTRDKGWECLEAEKARLTWLSLISFNNTWSVFGLRPSTDTDKKKEANAPPREILNWIDASTKTVHTPPALETAFKKNRAAKLVFDTLAFSHKKEYVEWIVTAKKEETKYARVQGTIERLLKGMKNPTAKN